jgi:hypothetical protein
VCGCSYRPILCASDEEFQSGIQKTRTDQAWTASPARGGAVA